MVIFLIETLPTVKCVIQSVIQHKRAFFLIRSNIQSNIHTQSAYNI